MSTTSVRPDIIIEAPDGEPIAIVELKNLLDLSCEVATSLRQSYVDRGLFGWAPYFLLLSQDKGYLWNQRTNGAPDASPTVEFSMKPVVRRYLPDVGDDERLRGAGLAFVVIPWLYALTTYDQSQRNEPEESLGRAGFLDAIRGEMVRIDSEL